MKKVFIVFLIFQTYSLLAQVFSCDSVQISSIELSSNSPTVEVWVKNTNLDYIAYPGFIMFDSSGDTLAQESIFYFGIGSNYQIHHLDILNTINLPLSGNLELHSWFYDSLVCTFPYIMGSVMRIDFSLTNKIKIFPNPTKDNINISLDNFNGNIRTEVYDLIGNKLLISTETTISLQDYPRGVFLLKIASGNRVEQVRVIKD